MLSLRLALCMYALLAFGRLDHINRGCQVSQMPQYIESPKVSASSASVRISAAANLSTRAYKNPQTYLHYYHLYLINAP